MLLVRGDGLRGPAGRPVRHLRLYRREREEPDLRAGLGGGDGSRGVGGGDLRPEGHELREAPGDLLAQRGPVPEGRTVLRSRPPVPLGDLLPGGRAEKGGRGVEGEARAGPEVQKQDRDGDHGRVGGLPGGGVSPGFLEEEPGALLLVPGRMRPRRPAETDLGRGGGRSQVKTIRGFLIAAAALAIALGACGEEPKMKGWNGNFVKPSDAELKKKLSPTQYDV